MSSRKIENEEVLGKIKVMISDLSVDVDSKENGFVNYPTANIDLLKNFIIDSDFSFGRFDDNNNLSAFLLAYPIDKLSGEIVRKDPIIHHIKQNKNYPQNGIYIDMIGVIQKMQGKIIGRNLIREIKKKAKEYGYKYLIGPVVISPHKNELSIGLIELEGGKLHETYEYGGLVFGIYKFDLE